MDREVVILKLGGSMFSKSEDVKFDYELAQNLYDKLKPFQRKFQFVIILGGGYLARSYQKYLKKYGLVNKDLDSVGVVANSLNATIMRTVLGSDAEDKVLMGDEITNLKTLSFDKTYQLIGGERPGQTGDMVAVNMAIKSGSSRVIVLKDVDGVYSADPHKDKSAKLMRKLTWQKYKDIMGEMEYHPGGSFPLDPKATEVSLQNNLEINVVGSDLDNLVSTVLREDFIGTVIQ